MIGIIGVIGFFVMLSASKKRSAMLSEIFERLVSKYGGFVQAHDAFTNPRLEINYDGTKAEVFVRRQGGNRGRRVKYLTMMTAVLPSVVGYKARVYSEQRIFGIGTVFGQDVKVNDPLFDEAFVVQGSDEAALLELLTPDIREKLLIIKDLNPQVEIKADKLQIKIAKILIEYEQYDHLIDCGLAIIKKIVAGSF